MRATIFLRYVWVLALLLGADRAWAKEACESAAGHLVSAEGQVDIQSATDQQWRPAALNRQSRLAWLQVLCQGDSIRVGKRSRAAVALINDAVLRLDQNTTIRLVNIVAKREERSLLSMIVGAFQSFSRKPNGLAVNTPYLNATVEGTEFVVRVSMDETSITVFEGVVVAANDQGSLTLASGQSAVVERGKAPVPRVVVRPRDAVQWALHYPPLLAVLGGRDAGVPGDLPAPMRHSLELAAAGDVSDAIDALDRVPAGQRDAAFHLQRAALLLSVGQVSDAGAGIDRALAQDSAAGLAYALRAVIAVVRNRVDQALADGARAVELSPKSAAAKIALSFAQQAAFRLDAARDTLLQAVTDQPEDALAWARLAELWLSLGDRGRSLEAAKTAVALEPELARTQVVLGFAALTEFRTAEARAAFNTAAALDSADPMPRLGLGLAKIRDGELAAGRKDIEVAVGLDGNNALLRAYLGKAYFEEKRAPLDGEQFAIAKHMDPNDPTAYLYDAIRKQSENRPGPALDALRASIARNDNRAVYRGRLQLDQDRAARGTSLARVYNDLGFQQLGLNEASRSLTLDPTNAAAHRFISDIYGGIRRREIARVSELLQAQLLQNININPVQPSVSETNLNIITGGGPAQAGFNEFTPLFERNQIRLNASGQVGSNNTSGGEAVVSAIYNQFSVSAGALGFNTDGFRDNNDIEHDVYNAYGQVAITPDLNLQAAYRNRKSTEGDLALNFNPDQFLNQKSRDLDQEIARVGARYSPTPDSDVLVSLIHSDRDEAFSETDPTGFAGLFALTTTDTFDDEGYQFEAQYLLRRNLFNLTAGFAYSAVDRRNERTIAVFNPFAGVLVTTTNQVRDSEFDHYRGYVYANLTYPANVTWTAGVSYDDYSEARDAVNLLTGAPRDTENLDVDEVNPKFGVQWDVTRALRLRATAFQIVKPELVSNRTIEPTQIAGFNQFFDDVNATELTEYGVGLDWQAMPNLALGAEAYRRDLDEPVFNTDAVVFEDRDERLFRAYLNWLPLPELAVSGQFIYDEYKSDQSVDTDIPRKVETISVPLAVRYFHPKGYFAGVGATYVHQKVNRDPASALAEGTSEFVTVDASVGWRLPNRIGIISLEGRNLFDNNFDYQDDSFREFKDEPAIGPYIPDRALLGRLMLNF